MEDKDLNKIVVLPARCFRCGCELVITGNDEWGDGEANRFYYTCQNCGDEYEECELQEEDKPNYPFWNEKLRK